MQPSRLVSRISFSSTLALDARAKELIARGVDVVNMTAGEPDFETPQRVREAARAKVESGRVRYTPAQGTASLRAAIAGHLWTTREVRYEPDEVAVCHSAKHALAAALFTLVDPGDEVLLPLPAWNSYSDQIVIPGGVPVLVPPRADLGPDFDAIARAIGPRTRGVLVNSPNNPSGYVWTRDEIAELAALAERADLWIVSDEIYRRLVLEGEPATSPAAVSGALRGRTVIVDGASKAFAMTGYRIGFAAAPRPVADAIAALNSQFTGSPNAVSQAAYEAALREEPPEVAEMVAEYARRRGVLVAGLRRAGLELATPRGAFYAFPRVTPFLDERGSKGFCEDLLEQAALAVVPGWVFGMDEHVRLAYSTSMERIETALQRLEGFLAPRRAATSARVPRS